MNAISRTVRFLAAVLVTAGCVAPSAHAGDPADVVATAGGAFVDARDGEVLLRGGNVIRKSNGRPLVSDHDIDVMRRLGWTTVRLGTGWRWFEPQEGSYDQQYADDFAALARRLMDAGFRVIADMHQDVWGAPHGNGAAAWTTPAECRDLHVDWAGYTGVWATNYFSPQTVCAFTRFWADTTLQDHLIEAFRMIARRLRDEPRFLGIDFMNEPFLGAIPPAAFEYGFLYPFYDRAAHAVAEIAPRAIAFEEPQAGKNVAMTAPPPLPRSRPAAYAPHVYGPWDANDVLGEERNRLIEANMRAARVEAAAADRPLWFGEFGIFNSAQGGEDSLSTIYDMADELHAGTAVWELWDPAYGPMRRDGSLIEPRATTMARAYPLRVGGRLRQVAFDRGSSRLTVDWDQRKRAGETVLVLPSLRYPGPVTVSLGPGVRAVSRTEGRLVVTAAPGARTVTVGPGDSCVTKARCVSLRIAKRRRR